MLLKEISVKYLEQKYKRQKNAKIKQRLHILLLLREGWTQREVAKMLHISNGIVPFWKKRVELGHFDALQDKEGRGIKPKMSDEELSMLRSAIEEPIPIGDGYYRWWKSKDVRIFLNKHFGLGYTRQYICRILHIIGCSLQVPRPRNKSRNQEKVHEFKKEFKKNEKIWIGV